MPDLSPATRAVLEAVTCAALERGYSGQAAHDIAAVALRTAADKILVRRGIPSSEYSLLMQMIDRDFRAIATELEH